jgi:NAD(P)H-hydrate epimerase
LVVADLGIPPAILEQTPGNLYLMVPEELRSLMLVRPESSHKGDFGHCLIVAGSPGMSGAAVLATQAAVAAGAGLVTVAVPTDLLVTLECASLESMSLGLSSDPSGHLALAAAPEVLTALESRDVLALGPGLGRSPETVAAAREIVASSACPAVIDADGLYALVGASELLLARGGTTVLTPHPGEAARLAGSSVEEIEADRIGFARRMAVEWNSVLVLKGHQTLVATPDGAVHVNTSGNPGMASGGCGDVLTGLVVALLAQGYSGEIAAILGVYLHGLAGDLALESRGEEGLRAGDLVEMLPQAFDSLRNA